MKQFTLRYKAGLFLLLLSTSLVSCDMGYVPGSKMPATTPQQKVERGKYLVNTMGCDDCHSPKKMGPTGPELDVEHRLSGYPASRPIASDTDAVKKGWVLFSGDLTQAVGPWGTSFAANLTPDISGIGNWTEAQFINALRKGKLKGLDNSRPLLPPMPWQNFSKLTDEDLSSIYAFLQSIKPVDNVVPAPIPPGGLK